MGSYVVIVENGWSYITGPRGYREGPIRYQWEAEEWADEMNNGKSPPQDMEQYREPPANRDRDVDK